MKDFSLTAPRLKILLIVAQVLIIIAGVGVFAFFYQMLGQYSESVKATKTQAIESEQQLNQLKLMEKGLANKQEAIKKAAAIVASKESYQYQNQVVNDLNSYAGRNSVRLSKIDFAPAATAGEGAATDPNAAATSSAIGGLTPTKVTVSLASPLKYENFMNFIYEIEKNLTKMQINKLEFSLLDEDSAPKGSLAGTSVELEVYIK